MWTPLVHFSITVKQQRSVDTGQIKAWVKGYMRNTQYVMILPTLLAVLTRFNRVVFDSFLHLVATGDGSALEEGKTRKVTTPIHLGPAL